MDMAAGGGGMAGLAWGLALLLPLLVCPGAAGEAKSLCRAVGAERYSALAMGAFVALALRALLRSCEVSSSMDLPVSPLRRSSSMRLAWSTRDDGAVVTVALMWAVGGSDSRLVGLWVLIETESACC